MYLLDTDHISIIQRQTEPEFSRFTARIESHHLTDFFVPIISFHEQIVGWNSYLNRATKPEAVVRAYAMFQNILADFSAMRVASFDTPSAEQFEILRSAKIRVGTIDLRIASIALANRWTLLTRNTVDFEKIPGLPIEDWTQ